MLLRIKQIVVNARAHAGFRRYAANTSWMFAEQILRMVAGLLVGIWVARYLGPTQFGLFSYATAFAALFSSISKLGLDSIVVRDLVREPSMRDVSMGTAFWLKFIGAILMLGAIGVVLQLTSSDKITKIYIFIIASGAIFQSFEVVDFYFQSLVMSKFVSICKLAQLVISSVIKIYLISVEADLISFVWVSLIDQITLAVTLYMAYRQQKNESFFPEFDLKAAQRMLKDSWPLILSGLVIMVYMRIDQIMIKEMLGEKEVGLYSAAVRISEIWYFIPIIINASFFPSVVSAKKLNEKQYQLRLQQLFTILVWIGIAAAMFTTLLSKWIVLYLYGSDYSEASRVLVIHVWGGIFVALGVVSGSWYINENLQIYAFYRTAVGAVINVILNLFLIPKYGISGAAMATFISQSFAALFFDLVEERTRKIFILKIKAIAFAGFMDRSVK